MDKNTSQIKKQVYDKCALGLSNFRLETESMEYDACRFELGARKIISRSAKLTPKKDGQFVTFWKRSEAGPIAPFDENDPFDFLVVNARSENGFGQFVFPKSVLIRQGIISTKSFEGKRAFRVYPMGNPPKNKQAMKSQQWQLNYFYEIDEETDLKKVIDLFQLN